MFINYLIMATKLEQALEVTWKGMLVIFLAIGLIFVATKIMNKIIKK